jgi:hypothetical protein
VLGVRLGFFRPFRFGQSMGLRWVPGCLNLRFGKNVNRGQVISGEVTKNYNEDKSKDQFFHFFKSYNKYKAFHSVEIAAVKFICES